MYTYWRVITRVYLVRVKGKTKQKKILELGTILSLTEHFYLQFNK